MTGEQLKEILYINKVSQTDLAEKLGISQQLLFSYLKAADVKTGLLEKICEALNVEMTFFYPSKNSTTIVNSNRNSGSENIVTGSVSGNVTATTGASEEALLMLLKQNQQILDMLNKK